MTLLFAKIIITMSVVLSLAAIAERISVRWAGTLAGFPLGIAIVLTFIALEQGAVFAAQAAQAAVLGLSANLALAFVYLAGARVASGLRGVLMACGVSVSAFLVIGSLLEPLGAWLLISVLVTLSLIIGAAFFSSYLPKAKLITSTSSTMIDLLFRSMLATASVLLITGAAAWLGPSKAGILAGFPVVALPLFMILHKRYGYQVLVGSIRAYPLGLMSLLLYTVAVAYTYPRLGIMLGTIVGFLVAIVYLGLVHLWSVRDRQD